MKIICIGRNYAAHIAELGNERPKRPIIFLKPDTALLKNNAPFYHPDFSKDIHHEVEILVKIKKEGKSIDPAFAHQYYDEIGLGIDFTARDLQFKLKGKGLPWEISKGFDGSAVIGKWVDKNKFENLNELNFTLSKNGDIDSGIFLYFSNQCPVCLTLIHLFASPTVNRQRLDPDILESFRHLFDIF